MAIKGAGGAVRDDAADRGERSGQRIRSGEVHEPALAHRLLACTDSAWIWLPIRVYLGWQWFAAGRSKLLDAAWPTGAPLVGFLQAALGKVAGPHPNVQGWYAVFLRTQVLPHAALWAGVIAWGELLVGLALILGLLTGVAAVFGSFLNLNYLLAGTVSTNPVLFVVATWLVLAWRVAGWWGLDRWVLPWLGTPWKPGPAWRHR